MEKQEQRWLRSDPELTRKAIDLVLETFDINGVPKWVAASACVNAFLLILQGLGASESSMKNFIIATGNAWRELGGIGEVYYDDKGDDEKQN